jgi:acyl-CoA thioesterase
MEEHPRPAGDNPSGERTTEERVAFIAAHDQLIDLFGMEVEEAREGFSRVSAVARDRFLNAHQLAHGSFIFALADVAFALAVNSLTDSVGVEYHLSLFRSTRLGEKLTAVCEVIHRGKRLLVVEFEVRNPVGKLLAKGQATAIPLQKP